MTRPVIPANGYARDFHNDRLHALVTRIAAGDRPAFRTLYAFLAMQVWRDAIRLLPPVDARAVTRSTFVEIWHLAGHHLDREDRGTCAWILTITARHIDDRIRSTGGRSLHRDGYDQHTHRELAALLGNGHATIRIAPATFTRVADLAPWEPSSATAGGSPGTTAITPTPITIDHVGTTPWPTAGGAGPERARSEGTSAR